MSGWMTQAACRDVDLDLLFGPRATQREMAVVYCHNCPVRAGCADEGSRQPYGLWGGLPEGSEGRPRLGRERGSADGLSVALPSGRQHGTAWAYDRAKCRCADCRGYKAAKQREYEQRRRDRASADTLADGTVGEVCRRLGVTVDEVRSGSRRHPLPDVRAELSWRLRQLGLSWPRIGRLLSIDHTSALAACRRYETREGVAA